MNKRLSLAALFLAGLILGCTSTTVETSPAAWNQINGGVSRQELLARLGKPNGRTATGGDTWTQGKWELRVEYDQRGNATTIVRQLNAR